MKDLLKNLREHLSAMIEEIDNYTHANSDDIIIKKEDLKWIKFSGKLNSYIHVFEYMNDVKFDLRVSPSYAYDYGIYKKLMDGTLEMLILNKREEAYESSGHSINYELEDYHNTKLRNLYSSVKEENTKTDNE